MPLIWNHPGRIRSGQVLSPMVSSYDFFPTILDYLGIRAPRDPKRVGNSYAAFLQGKRPRRPEAVYFEYGYSRAVRTRTMKYIERCGEWPSELYDLKVDPDEKQDRISDPAYAARLKELRAGLQSFFERAGAPKLEDWRSTTRQVLPEYSR